MISLSLAQGTGFFVPFSEVSLSEAKNFAKQN